MDLKSYRSQAPALYGDIEQVLTKHGFKLGQVSATIDSSCGTVKLSMKLSESSATQTPEEARFLVIGPMLGLKAEWLGKPVTIGGKEFTIAGMRDGKGVRKIIINRNGVSYTCTQSDLRNAMAS